jgi:AcrR family transcriptional regulator
MKKQTKAPAVRRNAAAEPRIGPQDWVRAGLSMLAREGIDAVRVEPLAALLRVTKGSFYWHFKDRAALHAAMLAAWREAATREIIRRVDAENLPARRRLPRLIELTTSNAKAARLETAIRAWAQIDPAVGKVLEGADAERLTYVADILRGTGMESSTADMRAKILYLVLIGSFFAASKSELEGGPELWREIVKLIL